MKKLWTLVALLLAVAPLSAQLTPKRVLDSQYAVVGDVNGDGLTDVIDGNVVQLNTGGAFAAPVPLSIKGKVLDVLDVNGDGVADLLTSENRLLAPFKIQLNDGHGKFTELTVPTRNFFSAADGAQIYVQPLIADFDGDGKDDLVVPFVASDDATSYTFDFLRSRGDGTFEQTQTLTIETGPVRFHWDQWRITAGDVNGDGKPDLILKSEETMAVLAGRGDGKFELLWHRYTSSEYGSGYGMKVADIDGDGHNDIVWSKSYDGVVTALFGDGRGGFPRMAVARVGDPAPDGLAQPVGQTVALVHYSSARRYDVAVGVPHSRVVVLTVENGAFRTAADVKLLDPVPLAAPTPTLEYPELNVYAGNFGAGANLYAFNSLSDWSPRPAFLLVAEKPAEELLPQRRRAAHLPGGRTVDAITTPLTLRIVPGYVDLISGRCSGSEDLYELQRDGVFAAGTARSGLKVEAIIESPNVIRVYGSGDHYTHADATLIRAADGHFHGTGSFPTTCGLNFTVEVDAYPIN